MSQEPTARITVGEPRELAGHRDLPPTSAFDRYDRVSEINRGGMGIILQAYDTHAKREVAIKQLKAEHAGQSEEVQKFLSEAQVTAQLEHPNIVPVHEVGVTGRGELFFSMKRVRGESLAELLERLAEAEAWGRQPPPEGSLPRLLDIIVKVCDAVALAHDRGVIHRDLKPDNIMIGRYHEVLVMDWGLAKVRNPEAAPLDPSALDSGRLLAHQLAALEQYDPTQTLPGTVLGTIAYMPPEQALGELHRIDERSDIYTLGACLYQMLTLTQPILEVDIEASLAIAQTGDIEAPSVRAPQRRIPAELEAVVLKAMAVDPDERYQHVAELQADLLAFVDGRTLQAARYNPLQRLLKLMLRHRALVLVVVLLLTLFGGVLSFLWWVERQQIPGLLANARLAVKARNYLEALDAYSHVLSIDSDHREALEKRAQVRLAHLQSLADARIAAIADERKREASKAIAEADALVSLAATPETLERLARETTLDGRETTESPRLREARVEALESYMAAASALDRALALDPDNSEARSRRRAVGRSLGRIALLGRDYTLARQAFVDLGRHGLPKAERDLLLAQVESARDRIRTYRAARLAAILADIERGLDRAGRAADAPALEDYVFEAVGYRDRQTVTLLGRALAPLIDRGRRFGKAVRWAEWERQLAEFCARVLGRLGQPEATRPLSRWLAVLHEPEMAVQAAVALAATRHPTAYAQLIRARDRLGVNSQAWHRIRPAFRRVPRPSGAQPTTAADLRRRAVDRYDHGDLEGALADCDAALALAPLAADILNTRGLVKHALRRLDEAAADLTRAIQLDGGRAEFFSNRGLIQLARGRLKEAEADLTRAIDLDAHNAQIHNNRGNARRAAGNLAGAMVDYQRAIELDPSFARAYANRGAVHLARTSLDAAIADLSAAIRLDPRMVRAYHDRGRAQALRGQPQSAMADFTEALRIDPRHRQTLHQRAVLRLGSGDLTGAIEDHTRIVRLAPRDPRPLLNRALAYLADKNHRDALADCAAARKLAPDLGDGYFVHGQIRLAQGQVDEAIEDFTMAMIKAPTLARAYLARGMALASQDKHRAAAVDLRRFLHLEPTSPHRKRIESYLAQSGG